MSETPGLIERTRDDMREALLRQMRTCRSISRASPFWDDRMREGADAVLENLCSAFGFEPEALITKYQPTIGRVDDV